MLISKIYENANEQTGNREYQNGLGLKPIDILPCGRAFNIAKRSLAAP
jgi:hypothetical protein